MKEAKMEYKSYAEKLKDPRWQKKRLHILERDEWSCQRCFDETTTLHIHHMRYIPGMEPWDYEDHLLVTLCETCHENEKETRKAYEDGLLDILKDCGFMADDIYSLTAGFVGLVSPYTPEVTATIIEHTLSNSMLWKEICDRYFESLKKK